MRVCGAYAQGDEADAGSVPGACTLEEHAAAVQDQCTAIAQFMLRLRERSRMHQERTAGLCGGLSRFASVLHGAFGNAQTSYAAGDVPECPLDGTDLGALCAYVCSMLEFIAALGCTTAGASSVQQVWRSMQQAARLSVQLPCAIHENEMKFVVVCLFAVVHQVEVPVDDMLAMALAQDGGVQVCDDVYLESFMLSSRTTADTSADRFAALEASYEEEQVPSLDVFARLCIRKEAWSAFEGDSVQGLIALLESLERAHTTVAGALTQVATVCGVNMQFAPHMPKRLTYAQLHGTLLDAAQAAVALEQQEWAATVRHANAVQRAARRTMLIWQSAFEPGTLPTPCSAPHHADSAERLRARTLPIICDQLPCGMPTPHHADSAERV